MTESDHPFKSKKDRAVRVRFDRLYNRVHELIASDSSLETDTITVKELAAALRIRPDTLRKWICRGYITPRRTKTGRVFFLKTDFIPELFQPGETYTAAEAAKIIKRQRRFVYALLKRGELAGRKYGGRWIITRDDLQDYFEAGVGLL